ncbi:MAG: oxaloacetate decarboxylase [Bacteroidia bacterium]|nr:oxaloacetate decarboxylase [Bacteroidia bacterium]
MPQEIRLCLLYRDMWQSAGKYMPRHDQLTQVAQPIIDMGCFARVETNGGGFEQIQLLSGHNPNQAVREWCAPFNKVGIQTQMLERGLNGIRMNPVPRDVRKLMFQVKKKQGTDIARSFDGLNDVRNIKDSITYAKAGGMIAQAALSVTHSPLHTVDYYHKLATELIEHGADEIAIKDMAGVGRPASTGELVRRIKKDFPNILVQYHGHSGPGFSVATTLEVARAGADIIDVSMEPLSWGTAHADLLTVHAMLLDAGFSLPDINMKAYMEVRSLTQSFIDEWLGYYISDSNRLMNSMLIGPGLPGGMMGSLMADLESNLSGLNKWLEKRGEAPLTQDDLLIRLFNEVEHIWPQMGYPPLVTPYSQYVKNVAMMNVLQMIKGRERWSMIDDNTWDMLLGKSGKVPGKIHQDLLDLAKSQGREFYDEHPQDLYPDALDEFRAEMKEKGWEAGQDEEELMELAMHPQQYRRFRSGEAKAEFLADLAGKKAPKEVPASLPQAQAATAPASPRSLTVKVNGQPYKVEIAYGDESSSTVANPIAAPAAVATPVPLPGNAAAYDILTPLEGKFYLTRETSDTPLKVGDKVKKGDTIGYVEAMKVFNAIVTDREGVIVSLKPNGTSVEEDDILATLQ